MVYFILNFGSLENSVSRLFLLIYFLFYFYIYFHILQCDIMSCNIGEIWRTHPKFFVFLTCHQAYTKWKLLNSNCWSIFGGNRQQLLCSSLSKFLEVSLDLKPWGVPALTTIRDTGFPGVPAVVRTMHFHCQGPGFNPWLGN